MPTIYFEDLNMPGQEIEDDPSEFVLHRMTVPIPNECIHEDCESKMKI